MTEHQFETIFKEHFEFLSNIAFAMIKDKDDAYDIVQQVFVKLWDKRYKVDIDDNIKAYLHRATINTTLNLIEKNKRSVNVSENKLETIPGQYVEKNTDFLSGEVENAIKKAISELPKKCGIVFSLSRYSDMTNKEIADHMNISVKAIEKHISRALRELRIKLKPYMNLLILFFITEVGLTIF